MNTQPPMSSNTNIAKESILGVWKQRISYGISDFACNLIWNMLTLYLMYFYTDVAGITAVTVGTMIMVTRLIDSFADMFTGVIIDKTRSKWGKSRPYILFGSLPLAVFGVLCFYAPNLSADGKVIYAYATYLGISICYGLVNIPISSILPSLTSNTRERTNLTTVRIVLAFIGATIVSVATLPLVHLLGRSSEVRGFVLTMGLYCFVAVLCLYITFRNVREKIKVVKQKVSIKDSFVALKGNKPWMIFAVSTLFMWGSNFFLQGSLIYYFTYNVGSKDMAAIIAGITSSIPLIGTILVPIIARRMLKRNIFLLGSLISFLGLVVMLIANINITGLIIGAVVYAIGFGMRQNMYFSMQADPVDFGEWKTGVNGAGLISAINGFIGKVAMAVSAALSGALLTWGHYVPHAHQDSQALLMIKSNFITIPAILIIISMLIMCFYNLDKHYPQIRKELDNRIG
ncbi:glycoside-pentoside-hexuronide (GPH):cation symporter [Sporolactobacillus terrae]|uniref:glycoside-pentoside-hexuronide (GPH):cation symporter n=1 Tax=Sporolactobacillus terrae TaxID=269673 RepID=UPI001C3F1A29|nr:glycoside-pentoside-hexuronide (GPH):cation symporter [Sporolactobacillus terrae]